MKEIPKIPYISRVPFVDVDDEWIKISAHAICMSFTKDQKEYLEDVVSRYYQDRYICVLATDGENLQNLGLVDFLKDLCDGLAIDSSRVVIISTNSIKDHGWKILNPRQAIFSQASEFVTAGSVNADAKLFGIALGRFSPGRLRVLYEIHQSLSDDTYTVCNFSSDELTWAEERLYHKETTETQWVRNKKFDQDPRLSDKLQNSGTLGWKLAYQYYNDLAANYHIEIVVETDPHSPQWFTEKTGKCLAAAKPFLLVGGKGSLQHLRDLGFMTFDSVIDENYDQAATLNSRLEKIIYVMKYLRDSPHRTNLLDSMKKIAYHNSRNFHDIISAANATKFLPPVQ